jgi:hypothetical protein
MHLDEYVTQIQRQLADAASLGDDAVQRVAGILAAAAGPAVRLAIMAALAEAADEVTALLLDVPGSPVVSVRLDGDSVHTELAAGAPDDADVRSDDGEQSARISLRLSESLKSEVDAAATRDGVSVNTWLVRAAATAVSGPRGAWNDRRGPQHRLTGYINS